MANVNEVSTTRSGRGTSDRRRCVVAGVVVVVAGASCCWSEAAPVSSRRVARGVNDECK